MQTERTPSGWLLIAEQFIPRPRTEVFAFFSNAANLETITPPWLNFRIVTETPIEMRAGALIDYRIRLRLMPLKWRTEISVWEPPARFVDRQLRGPYRKWIHEHRFEECDGGTLVTDRIEYDVVGGWLVHEALVKPDVQKIFAYRQERLRQIFPEPAG